MISSVITFIPSNANNSATAIKDQISKAKDLVTDGRY